MGELESFKINSGRPAGYQGCGPNNIYNSSLAPLFKLAKLKELDTEYTCTGGTLDGIEGLKSIESFQVHGNYIAGTIPATIAELTNVQVLKLGRNPLTGTVPAVTTLKKTRAVQLQLLRTHWPIP